MNECEFSPCRKYRYSLLHRWDELVQPRRLIAWIGLNPSTADEQQLDPTLRRVKAFSSGWGFNEFVMLNLFAFRATLPARMKVEADPAGPDNKLTILKWCDRAEFTVAAWGGHGSHLGMGDILSAILLERLVERQAPIRCLGTNIDGSPRHPLYLAASTPLEPWP